MLWIPPLLFSMVAHEYAHGYAALKQGDSTAYDLGRLSWNPAKHIDPFMTIILPVLTFFTAGVAFGGAKPVPVDPRNFRNLRRGDIIVSLAGVTVNMILAVMLVPVIIAVGLLGRELTAANDSLAIIQRMLVNGILVNLVLAAFNLMPIPPLDGSHVVKYMLPRPIAIQYQRIGAYGLIILMLLLTMGRGVIEFWMRPAFDLARIALRTFFPYVLSSPWT
jgi:Zn-dependent protease